MKIGDIQKKRIMITFLFLWFLAMNVAAFMLVTYLPATEKIKYLDPILQFAVDDNENVYILQTGKIYVVKDNQIISRIPSEGTIRGLRFALNKQNHLILSGLSSTLREVDWQGNVLNTFDETDSEYSVDDSMKFIFRSTSGKIYRMRNYLGRTKINRVDEDGEVTIFQIPLKEYVINTILYLVMGSGVIFVIIINYLFRKYKVFD